MSESCCDSKGLEKLHQSQARTLWIVLWINALMFAVELSFGIFSGSLALVSDSLDMLGDFLAYGVSLYVIHRGLGAKVKASRFKAYLILFAGLGGFAQALYRFVQQDMPQYEFMGSIGFLALAANLLCLYLLTKHRDDDINFKSVWLCSRNDIIANISVLIAAAAVFLSQSPWPDLIVGFGILVVFFRSAFFILKESVEVRASL